MFGGVEVERAPEPAPLLFVGGTGRSGTHVLAQLVSPPRRASASSRSRSASTSTSDGFPGLLAGEVAPERFLERLRGFWWRGFQTNRMRGMYRFVERERFEAAVERFEAEPRRRPRGGLPRRSSSTCSRSAPGEGAGV